MRRRIGAVLTVAVLGGLLALLALSGRGEQAQAQSPPPTPPGSSSGIVPGQFIVVVNGVHDPARVAADHAAVPLHVYRVAVRGFAARLSQLQVDALHADPRVNNVVPDQRVAITCHKSQHNCSEGGGPTGSDTVPTGVNRIDAEAVTGGSPTVAIVDTGIDLDHPDLNVVVVNECGFSAFGGSPDDGNGHGTHVAGTAAAKANGQGVRGVYPGAPLCAVKVLDDSGSGTWSGVIAGIDYVTVNASRIKVANMSLSGCAVVWFIFCLGSPPPDNATCGVSSTGTVTDPLHKAICNSTTAGVVYVVAASNDDFYAIAFVPGAYPEVITVGAVADYNGKGPAFGSAQAPRGCNYGPDDTYATFSNFNDNDGTYFPNDNTVDISAPGVCIKSTWKAGGYKTISGTSMATPHVTGAVAERIGAGVLSVTASSDPAAARNAAMAQLQTKAGPPTSDANCGYSPDYQFPNEYGGPMLYVGPDPAPSPACN